jgi:hypothetical protein
VHPEKAKPAIVFTLSGITNSPVSPLHVAKASGPIVSILLGRISLPVIFLFSLKASLPIEVIRTFLPLCQMYSGISKS